MTRLPAITEQRDWERHPLCSLYGCRTRTVNFARDRFEMIGPDAKVNHTQVVNLQSDGNWPIGQFVGDAMGQRGAVATLPDRANRNVEFAIARMKAVTRPKPAVAGFVNLGPKALSDGPPSFSLTISTRSQRVAVAIPSAVVLPAPTVRDDRTLTFRDGTLTTHRELLSRCHAAGRQHVAAALNYRGVRL